MTGQAGMAPYAVDSTVTHLHGGKVPWTADGHPVRVPGQRTILGHGESAAYTYPNDQPGTTLWFHDHVMGSTAANVYAGLAGIYLVRSTDPDETALGIPVGDQHEISLLLGDRSFAADGTVIYGAAFGATDPPAGRPYHTDDQAPEFKGDTIIVNGAVWPHLDVERTPYRFRVVNAASSRFFKLVLRADLTPGTPGTTSDIVADVTTALPIVQIGGDGGFLPVPYRTDDPGGPGAVLLGPGERADLLVDFGAYPQGTRLLLCNEVAAESDNPNGEWPPFTTSLEGNGGDMTVTVTQPQVGGQLPTAWVMQFRVGAAPRRTRSMPTLDFTGSPQIGAALDALRAAAAAVVAPRQFRISEVDQGQEPAQPQIQSTTWLGWYAPRLGQPADHVHRDDVEIWELTNVSPDTHPMHLHLVQFLVQSRENVDGTPVARPGGAADGVDPAERGWKDTLRCGTGQRTRFAVRFTGYEGRSVWHCHILEHEDMGMMRPLFVLPPKP
jgi:spore coat protein A, manganese oxidase